MWSVIITSVISVIDYLRLIIFLNVIAPRPVMCSFMLIYQCCFAIVKVLLKKVTQQVKYSFPFISLQSNAINEHRKWYTITIAKISKLSKNVCVSLIPRHTLWRRKYLYDYWKKLFIRLYTKNRLAPVMCHYSNFNQIILTTEFVINH